MSKEFRIYRANKDATKGAATKFNLSLKKFEKHNELMLFLESAKQTGVDQNDNARFGWSDKAKPETKATSIVMKLEELDIGELIAVLRGIKNEVGTNGKGLFHKTPKANAVLNFGCYIKDGNLMGYNLKVSRKIDGEATATAISHSVSIAEGCCLLVLLEQSLKLKFEWN